LLGAAIFPAATLVAGIRNKGFTADALFVAAAAGSVCWFAAVLALVVTYFSNRNGFPIQGVLAGMLFRMAPPLAAIVALPTLNQRLATGGFTATVLGAYLVSLAVETTLALKIAVPRAKRGGDGPTTVERFTAPGNEV